MKKTLILFAVLLISTGAFADGLDDIKALTLKGYKMIRHDALIRLKFRKVHEMNLLIKNFK
jgi:hypothetical protein